MEYEINLPKIDATMTIDLTGISDEALQGLIRFGLQEAANNACGAIKASDYKSETALREALDAAIASRVANIRANKFGAGGGRKADDVEAECRTIAETALRAGGMKAAEARRQSAKWKALITDQVVQAAKKANVTDKERIEKAVETAIANRRAEAEAAVAARRASSVDIQF